MCDRTLCTVSVPWALVALLQLLSASAASGATPGAQWLDARQIEYRITGEYDGRFPLDATGDAHALDRVEIDFVTNPDGELQGEVTIRNFASTVTDLQPLPAGCRKPELQGDIEFFTLTAFQCMACNPTLAAHADPEESDAASRNMTMSVAESEQQLPNMVVGASCTGQRSIPARTLKQGEMVMIPGRGEYMMDPSQLNSPDRQLDPGTNTIIERKSGWTWRYQATPVGN